MSNEPTRDSRGRFSGGHQSPDTEFKKGYTWRDPRPYWDEGWLAKELENKSPIRIASEQGVHYNTIYHFIRKLGLKEK